MKTKTNKTALIPRLRFPEFQNSGEWEKKTLDNLVTDFIVPMRDKPKKLDGDIPWCRIEDFEGMYLSGSKSNQGVSLETIKEMNLKVYPVNTLLVSCSADLGKCAITQKPLITNQTFIGLVPDTKKINTVYLYYLMTNSRDELNQRSSGTTISYLSRRQFEKFEILIPPDKDKKEQQKIASCLSSLDEVIAGERQRLELLNAHKKGLLQNLFPQEGETVPKLRFPEFKDSGEWVEKKLGEVLLKNDKIEKMIHFDKEKLLTIKLHTLGVIKNENTSTRSGGANYFKRYADQFIFSKIDFLNGAFGLVPKHLDGFYSSSDLPAFSFNSNINPFFFINWLKSTYKSIKIERTGTSSTLKRISLKDFFKIKFLIPSLPEQQKIASCLSSLDDLIQAHQQKIELLEQHKKGLLQGLFPNVYDVDNG